MGVGAKVVLWDWNGITAAVVIASMRTSAGFGSWKAMWTMMPLADTAASTY